MELEGSPPKYMGKMVSPSKFQFNVDFSAPPEPEVVEPPKPEIPMIPVAEHQALLQKAKDQAFEEGRIAALKEHQSLQDTLLTEEVGRLIASMETVLHTIDEAQAAQEQDSVNLAFMVARRLCAHLIARQPMTEIMALITECLGPLRRSPHVVVRINERDVEALKKRIDPVVHEKGFEGRIVILGEPEIARGDCHIEWADGGIIRDRKALEKEIDGSIKSYLLARANKKKAARADEAADTAKDQAQ